MYWTSDYFLGGVDRLYRPLVSMCYAVQWLIHGDRPWAFHAVNWLLHAAVSASVAELARRLAGRRAALRRGAAVRGPPGARRGGGQHRRAGGDRCCASGSVGALVLMARRPMTLARAAGIAACYVLAVLSKEQGMLLPLLMLVLGWVVHRLQGSCRRPKRTSRRHAGPQGAVTPPERRAVLLLVLARAGRWRGTSLRGRRDPVLVGPVAAGLDVNPMVLSRGADQWLVPLGLLGRYAVLLVAPWACRSTTGGGHPVSRAGSATLTCDLGAAALALWVALLVRIAGEALRWAAVFCLLAVGITYGMVANVLTLIGTIFAERLMYLPSAFFLILAASAGPPAAAGGCRGDWCPAVY